MRDKVEYFKHKILINKKFVDKRILLIDKYSKANNISRDELYGVLIIEHINRGKLLTKLIEKFAVKFFVDRSIRLDLSLGIGQIKISTTKLYYPDKDIKSIARELLRDEFNISVAAQIIFDYHRKFNEKNQLLGLVKYYTTGNSANESNEEIILYYKLIKWIIEESWIEK